MYFQFWKLDLVNLRSGRSRDILRLRDGVLTDSAFAETWRISFVYVVGFMLIKPFNLFRGDEAGT